MGSDECGMSELLLVLGVGLKKTQFIEIKTYHWAWDSEGSQWYLYWLEGAELVEGIQSSSVSLQVVVL